MAAMADRPTEPPGDRLFRYDLAIARNATRATFASWHDRLIAATLLLFALAFVHGWLAERPWRVAAWVGAGATVLIGTTIGRSIATRLAFYASDGPLAALALHRGTRWRYVLAWHAVALSMVTIVILIIRPSLAIVLPAYLIGVLVGLVPGHVGLPNGSTAIAPVIRTIRAALQHPRAGVAAAAILLVSLTAFAGALPHDALVAVAGIEALMLALAFTIVDPSVVRFMTISGHGTLSVILRHARATLAFLPIAALPCWPAFGPVVAGIIAVAAIVALLLMAMRILAYRIHGRRFADLLVAILAALLILVAVSLPVLLPVVTLAILRRLQRRASMQTWMLS